MPTEPTPRPWHVEGGAVYAEDGRFLADCDSFHVDDDVVDANAALIVRAVNAHEELLALGDELVQSLHNELSEIEGTVAEPALREDIARVRAVLARIRNS
jgi:hypothetical protein